MNGCTANGSKLKLERGDVFVDVDDGTISEEEADEDIYDNFFEF